MFNEKLPVLEESPAHAARRALLGLANDRPFFEGFDPVRLPSPCFVVDRASLQYNLDILQSIADASGCSVLLALKAFSMFAVFDQVRESLSGSCASGVHEARLGRDELGTEVHTFAPAYSDTQVRELLDTTDHLVFNSLAQWIKFKDLCLKAQSEQSDKREREGRLPLSFGIRINPECSQGKVAIYDACAPFSRLGTTRKSFDATLAQAASTTHAGTALLRHAGAHTILHGLSGLHFHALCEQDSFALEKLVAAVEEKWGDVLGLQQFQWLNMGGGHHITKPHYDRNHLIHILKEIRSKYDVHVYLEPGEAIAIHTGVLVATVLDIAHNGMDLAILDVSATCHMPDTLEMPYRPSIWNARLPGEAPYTFRLGGQTCLAGDVIGDYAFAKPLQVGDRVVIDDMSHYTMVKMSTFNGIGLPSLATYDSRTGDLQVVKTFDYSSFRDRLS
ncbi:MAG: carboxynorspermidine decarboxylase [Pirellulaceae bacterium]|nr:carboxynorspermidine decarboxylase [Pirellulaceae bacterium]